MVKKLNLFLFIGFLLLLSSISFSVTRYVNNTDADATACGVAGNINYSTIQAAVLAMDAYDTIIVCYSTTPYGANLNITKPGTFTGVGSLVPVYFNTTTTTQSYIFRLISGNVNVSGFYFMNSTNSISTTAGPYGVAVSIVNSSISVNISNNKFENLTSAIELYENSSNVYFENNTVINSSGVVPVRLYFSSTPISNLSIFNNTIFGNNTNATHCSGAPCYGVYLNNVNSTSIKGNIFTNGSYAVYIFNSRGATSAGQVKILDNIVSKSLTGFYVGNSTQVNISRNSISSLDTISTEGGYGMYISTSNYTFISANNISNTAQDAFKLFNISNSSIIDNLSTLIIAIQLLYSVILACPESF